MTSALTAHEREILIQIIEESLLDLHTEIHETDDRNFKLRLKRKEETLRGILEKLEDAAITAEV